MESDCLQLHLVDSPPLEPPREGTRLEVALGFDGVLHDVGVYGTRPISLKGPPATASIEASVLDCFPTLRIPKKRSWRPDSLASVLVKVSKEHGLVPSIDKTCAAIKLPHQDQTESDAAFIARIAEYYELIFKIQRDHLIVYDRDSPTTPAGTSLDITRITRIISYDFKYTAEPVYSGVKAFWWDKNSAKQKSVLAGKEGRVHAIKFLLKDEASARDAAEARFRKLRRLGSRLSITIPGNPLHFAGGRCIIASIHPLLDREWYIAAVEHSFDNNGFTTNLTLEGYAFHESPRSTLPLPH